MTDLKHIGVIGMKWGVRKRVSSPEHSSVRSILKTKKLHEMTNAEIRQVTTRLQLEKQFKDLSAAKQSKGQKILLGLLATVGAKAFNSYAAGRAAQDPAFNNIKTVFEALRNKQKQG